MSDFHATVIANAEAHEAWQTEHVRLLYHPKVPKISHLLPRMELRMTRGFFVRRCALRNSVPRAEVSADAAEHQNPLRVFCSPTRAEVSRAFQTVCFASAFTDLELVSQTSKLPPTTSTTIPRVFFLLAQWQPVICDCSSQFHLQWMNYTLCGPQQHIINAWINPKLTHHHLLETIFLLLVSGNMAEQHLQRAESIKPLWRGKPAWSDLFSILPTANRAHTTLLYS